MLSCKGEEINEAKDFALLGGVVLHALEVAPLVAGGVADVGLLLLVDLSGVDYLLDGAGADEAEDFDVADLADAVGTVLGLEVPGWVPVWL